MSTLDDIRAAIATWDNPVHPEDARWLTTGICLDGKDSRLHSTKQLREWCQHLLRAVALNSTPGSSRAGKPAMPTRRI